MLLFSQAVASQSINTVRSVTDNFVGLLTDFFVLVVGDHTVKNAEQACEDAPFRENSRVGCTGVALYFFFFICPGILIYRIMMDMFLFTSFMRKSTSELIAISFAIFGARTGAYFKLAQELNHFSNNTITSMFTVVLFMAGFSWTLGQLLFGFNMARNLRVEKDAVHYLKTVGNEVRRPRHERNLYY